MSRSGLFRAVLAAMILGSPELHAACEQVIQIDWADPVMGWVWSFRSPTPLATKREACDYDSTYYGFKLKVCTDVRGLDECVSEQDVSCSNGGQFAYIPYCPVGYDASIGTYPGDPNWGRCSRIIDTPVSYIVRLINETERTRPGYLAEVEPKHPAGDNPSSFVPLRARVTCSGDQPAAGIQVEIKADVVDQSGGHKHTEGRHVYPHQGSVRVPHAFTDADGYVNFTFHAPEAAGDHWVSARCLNRNCGTADGKVWVGIKDLVSLYDTHLYRLVGIQDSHPRSHYLTWDVTGSMVWLAELYKAEFPTDPVLHLNDASLERGGLFDLRYNWSQYPVGHERHRHGNIIDIVANPAIHPGMAIPERNFEEFEKLACRTGGVAEPHSRGSSNQHYHVEFTGCTPRMNANTTEAEPAPPPGGESPPGEDPVVGCSGPNPDPGCF